MRKGLVLLAILSLSAAGQESDSKKVDAKIRALHKGMEKVWERADAEITRCEKKVEEAAKSKNSSLTGQNLHDCQDRISSTRSAILAEFSTTQSVLKELVPDGLSLAACPGYVDNLAELIRKAEKQILMTTADLMLSCELMTREEAKKHAADTSDLLHSR